MKKKVLDKFDDFENDNPAKIDIFNEFEELDYIEIDEEDNPITYHDLKIDLNDTSLLDEFDIDFGKIKEEKDKLESIKEENDDLENTKEIDNFQDEILEKLEELKEENVAKEEDTPEEDVPLEEEIPEEVAPQEEAKSKKKIMTMEASFIYCSILGFLVLFVGYGAYLYIITHI